MKPFAVSDSLMRLATTETTTSSGSSSPRSMMCLAGSPNVEPEAAQQESFARRAHQANCNGALRGARPPLNSQRYHRNSQIVARVRLREGFIQPERLFNNDLDRMPESRRCMLRRFRLISLSLPIVIASFAATSSFAANPDQRLTESRLDKTAKASSTYQIPPRGVRPTMRSWRHHSEFVSRAKEQATRPRVLLWVQKRKSRPCGGRAAFPPVSGHRRTVSNSDDSGVYCSRRRGD
jgi:hypothetical protein